MKEPEEVTACVMDAGTFVSLAACLAKTFKKVYYYSPWESEYLDVSRCVIGDGEETFSRLDEPLDPDVFPSIDLFIFPDIGYAGLQRHLVSLGKAVWGSRRGTNLELYRTKFLRVIGEAGLEVIGSQVIRGVTALSEHLKSVENKWVKVNRFRGNMETWHHKDFDHSRQELNRLALTFGGVADEVVFVVQDPIDGDDENPVLEIGYDGWSILGQYPEKSFQGYEQKNELYLGSVKAYVDLPEEIQFVNERMAPYLEANDYRNFWATEIRMCKGKAYFIDPTARMPGQTGEQLLNTCTDLARVIWAGANGQLIQPDFRAICAAEATIHFKGSENDQWKMLRIPQKALPYLALYQYCRGDGDLYHFPPARNDEAGVVIGEGGNVEDALTDLSQNFSLLSDEPVSIDFKGFADLLEQIKDAENEGVEFTDEKIPEPSVVVEAHD